MLYGSRSGSGTESKAIDGTACWAKADGAINNNSPASQYLMISSRIHSLSFCCLFVLLALCHGCQSTATPGVARHNRSSSSVWHRRMRARIAEYSLTAGVAGGASLHVLASTAFGPASKILLS